MDGVQGRGGGWIIVNADLREKGLSGEGAKDRVMWRRLTDRTSTPAECEKVMENNKEVSVLVARRGHCIAHLRGVLRCCGANHSDAATDSYAR